MNRRVTRRKIEEGLRLEKEGAVVLEFHGATVTSDAGLLAFRELDDALGLTALADLSGRWIDRVQGQRARTALVLDIDSSGSPTHGAQEGTAYNGHFACACYHPLFVFNQDGALERCTLRPGNVHIAPHPRVLGTPTLPLSAVD